MGGNVIKSTFFVGCGACALLTCGPAAAQVAASSPPSQAGAATDQRSFTPSRNAAPAVLGAASTPTPTVGEVVVTASRRSEKIVDVPGQVGTVSGAQLEKLKATTLADFAAFTPGVSFSSSAPGTNLVAIRGVTTGGTQLSSAIGLYLDDVPVGSSTPFGLGALAFDVGTFDIQRIEVLNGPQGTLYGANALGGTLKYITAPPSVTAYSGQIEGQGGFTEHGGANAAVRGMINLPLVEDRVALRLDALSEEDSGFVNDPGRGRTGLGDSRSVGGRAALLARLTDDLTVRLNIFGQRIASNGLNVAFRDPVTHAQTQGPYDQSYQLNQPSRFGVAIGSGVIDWNLHWAKLTSITAYQYNIGRTDADDSVPYSAIISSILGPAGVNPYLVGFNTLTDRFTQEVRLASPDNHVFEWVVGGFFSRESTDEKVTLRNASNPAGTLFGLPLGAFDLPSTAREYATFGDATYYFTPKLDATAGIRYSWNHEVFTQYASGLIPSPANPFATTFNSAAADESVPTYLFNLRYHFTPNTMVYGRVASGYRPGGPNLILTSTTNATFSADKLWNYEVGFKTSIFGGKGFFNADIYHIDWSSIQLAVNQGGVNQLVNGGNARVNGAEGSISYRLTKNFNVLASGAYTDAKLTTVAPLLGINYQGARLPLSPRFSGAIAADYAFEAPAGFTGDVDLAYRYVSNRNSGFAGSALAPLYVLAPYTIVDLSLTLTSRGGVEISPFIKNLFDERGEVAASTGANIYVPTTAVPVTLTRARTFGLTVGKSF